MQRSTLPLALPLEKAYPHLRVVDEPVRLKWRKLAIVTTEETRFVPYDDILYCKSLSNYTTIYVQGGKSYLCSKTLKDIEAKLPSDQFLRIHDSYLVNVQSVTCLKKKTGEMEIENTILLPISRAKKTAIYQLFNL
ncbi:MAG: LytTR family transcriptional regulator [Chitinophagaceae bacterium]|nr:MAG: LytTR family transcriptional regulator [Chitinophagaceae bacterium]